MGITAKSRQKRAISAPRPDKVDTPQKARKGGRPRKKAQQEAFERDSLMFETPYSETELYRLWWKFRDNPSAATMLSDFAGTTRKNASAMIDKWRQQMTQQKKHTELPPPPVSSDDWDW